ncbi:MAG: putative baseplate assembly protein [Mucilaginibacter sp.]|nr:putative baseplate assembly protein [Mucilaginibacter sp.]
MTNQNTCHCCEGLSVQTPVQISNRAGLNAVAYRVGTHAQFKESLLAGLSLSGAPALQGFTTREDNDFTIALLDAWSVVSDVLTFYQERIANESYLGTATERLSVLELARLIGYELRPGVAAGTYIAFTVDSSSGALGPVLPAGNLSGLLINLPPITIDKGIKIQSIPGPAEKPQLFETVESINARAEWNSIKPRLTQPQIPLNDGVLLFNNTNNNLKKGDTLLVRQPGGTTLKTILNVIIDNDAKTTRVDLVDSPTLPQYHLPVAQPGVFTEFFGTRLLKQPTLLKLVNRNWREADLSVLIRANRWSATEVFQSINTPAVSQPDPSAPEIYVFRKKVPVFGYNAPKKINYVNGVPSNPVTWTDWDNVETEGVLYLDSAYEDILPGSQIAIQNPENAGNSPLFLKVDKASVSSRTEYGLSTKTTQLSVLPSNQWWGIDRAFKRIRSVTVYAQSEKLDLAELPVETTVEGDSLTLDRYYPGLQEGQAVIVSGMRNDLQGVTGSEIRILKTVNIVEGFTELKFIRSLSFNYIRKTVTINANVAKATHGETVSEVLGGGDASQVFQQFTLKQPPLTFISSASGNGVQTTLEIRVNDLLWHEVDFFLDHGPNERIYITRQDNEGNTTVTFGDGINGARVPTGQQNIQATYRKGIGTSGLVKANQLSQLLTKPLGVKSAVNPVAPAGAEDPEQLDSARNNASLTILTLDRVVSLQDYEDFARAFPGIEKSLATWTWVSGKRHIFITVAGSNGTEVPPESDLYKDILKAINSAGDPEVSLRIDSYSPVFFQLTANLMLDPDYIPAIVQAAVEQNLRDTFSFQARSFAQPVNYSEVVACMQQTPGVVAVDIDSLFRTDNPVNDIQYFINAAMPMITATNVVGAELLTLDPRPVGLKVIK